MAALAVVRLLIVLQTTCVIQGADNAMPKMGTAQWAKVTLCVVQGPRVTSSMGSPFWVAVQKSFARATHRQIVRKLRVILVSTVCSCYLTSLVVVCRLLDRKPTTALKGFLGSFSPYFSRDSL